MRRGLAILALLAACAAPLRAQSNTSEMLQRAIRLYENLDIEQSLVILNQIISPSSPFQVSEAQRVTAFKYLGAALALQRGEAKRDSAILYFRAALERDPFTDLDPQSFSPSQIQVFGRARGETFAVGLKPVLADTIDPRIQRFRLRALTTHAAHLRLEIRSGGQTRRVVYDGDNNGLRELEWDGLADDGRLLAAGRYQIVVLGESRVIRTAQVRDTAFVFFQLGWLNEPLEDTLATLQDTDMLPEQYAASAATGDLLKGVGVAAAALLTQSVLANSQLGANRTAAGVVALGGVTAGVTAFFVRQGHRAIPQNILANAQRRAERETTNAAIRARNDARLGEARLTIAPAAGAGQ
jgi:hypothetical protein